MRIKSYFFSKAYPRSYKVLITTDGFIQRVRPETLFDGRLSQLLSLCPCLFGGTDFQTFSRQMITVFTLLLYMYKLKNNNLELYLSSKGNLIKRQI